MDNIRRWFENLYFSEPTYFIFFNILWILVAALVVIIILKLIYRPRKSKYSKYQLFGKDTAWVAALAICALSVVALAGPKVSKGMRLTPGGSIDVGFLVDYSFSTKTDDIDGKSRLDVMKTVIANFVDSGTLKPGDRVTLFIFGTLSFWRMSFSEDFNDFRSKLTEIMHPQIYQEDSQFNTDILNVIEHIPRAEDKDNLFEKKARSLNISWLKNNKVMFLFSDGDDNENTDQSREIRKLRVFKELNKRNIKIYSVGVGTKESKEITIEGYDPNNPNKTIKTTKKIGLKMQWLNEIAAKTGGEAYVLNSSAGISGAQNFLKNAVNSNRTFTPRLVASGESQDIWWEVLAIPVVILLLIMIKIL